jgi:hypothetical protein
MEWQQQKNSKRRKEENKTTISYQFFRLNDF